MRKRDRSGQADRKRTGGSKGAAAMAAVLEGKVDAILLIGGMANVPFITGNIQRRVRFIAPVVILPGEREMEALAEGSYRALKGEIPMQTFVPGN